MESSSVGAGTEPADGTVEAPPQGAQDVFGDAWEGVQRFASKLAAEGELRGLIGPRELPRLWTRHLLNSAAIDGFIPGSARSFADVGSGAGFPGVVVALLRPELQVTLIEPMDRRTAWLSDVVRWLNLDNVRVHRARAEELHGRETFDVVSARAVANLRKLAGWTLPLVAPGGLLVALKGEQAMAEIEDAQPVLRKLGAPSAVVHEVPVVGTDVPARIVVAERRP